MKKLPIFIGRIFFFIPIISFLLFLIKPEPVWAVCPVCTVAVCASLGLSRWLKVDDAIAGVWIGALILSSSLWLANWLKDKKIRFPRPKIILPILSYLTVLIPLYYKEILGHPLNKFCGIDKLLFGIIAGSAVFLVGIVLDKILRRTNKGKVVFYYQKVILPLSLLLIASLVLYFLLK